MTDALASAALKRAGMHDCVAVIHSDIPPGAGLGGSSAAGVALQAAIATWKHDTPDTDELVRRSRDVEVEELGVAGGWQDHYAAAFGGALGLTFTDVTSVDQLPLDDGLAADLSRRCVVAYTGESRISGATITAVLDAYRDRAPHVVHALARMAALARRMADAIRQRSIDDLGRLIGEHWEHQRALHPRITTESIDRVLGIAERHGALGGKALGASGGGCVVAIAPDGREDEIRHAVGEMFTLVPCDIDRRGVRVELS
jgi:D-glycero-alpha-D-manno-heptose-7-phosphate kinase